MVEDPVDLHVVLPDESVDVEPRRIAELAGRAEELGYGGVWLPDHLLPPGEYGPPPAAYGGVYEPLVLLSYIAARTERVRLGTSILILPLRNPFALAKQVATLDRLAGGRCSLGVGIGWEATEFANVGVDFADRAGRSDEALRLLRHLFDTGSGPFEGERFGFDTGVFVPRPTDGLRIVIGGNSDAALRRVARYGDGWQSLPVPPDQFAERVAHLRDLADRPVEVGVRTEWTGGSLDDIRTQIRDYEAAGADYVAIWFGELDGSDDRMTTLAEAEAQALP
jgi:probable F420-dependent oxidoreductase